MPRNGSGVYGPPAGTPGVPNTPIESAKHNAFVADISEAMTRSANVDGTAPYQANQPMGGNKLTGLAAGSAMSDSANVGQIQSDLVAHATTVSGSADAISLAFSPTFAAYVSKMRFRFTANAANTTVNPAISIDGLGTKAVKKLDAQALEVGDITGAGHVCECVYDGTDVIFLNPGFWPGRTNVFTAKQTFSKSTITPMTNLTDAPTIVWDMGTTSNDVKIVLTASRNLGLPTSIQTGMRGLLIVQMDGAGGWSLTLNSIFDLSGDQTVLDLDKTANAQTIYLYEVIDDHTTAQKIRLQRIYSTGRNSIGFYRDFDFGVWSSDNRIVQVDHLLGRHPSLMICYVECIAADFGYSVGDRIVLYQGVVDTGSGDAVHYGLSVGSSLTKAWIIFGNGASTKAKSTGVSVTLSSNFRAWLRVYE